MWALVGSQDSNILQVVVQIYRGEYSVVASVFMCAEQEDFVRELQWDLSGQMTRAGLQSKRGPAELPSRSWRHSQGLGEGDQACEVEQQSGQSKSRRRQTKSRGRNGQGGIKAPPLYIQASANPLP